ncbi:hypothetical protein JKF63_07139 [Porcisia hertigi]|uniref:Uncharacterized protein n=1 Tax=Porcisia hertigi TaxID=2761500 RepID=A0A836LKE8_9TRYP|nr:hypothetical protein JKF63_07139 [Porcisia hertigi]
MIRVFAKTIVPAMDIVELQGKVVITEDALSAARDAKERRRASRREPHPNREANSGTAVGEDAAGMASDTASLSCASSSSCSSFEYSSSSSRAFDEHEDNRGDGATADNSEGAEYRVCHLASRAGGDQRCAVARSTSATAPAPFGTSSSAQSLSAGRRAAAAVVEVPLGHVEQDHLSEKRCSLCIDTLRIHGSRSDFKRPWLVLRECTPARFRKLCRQIARKPVPHDDAPLAPAVLTTDGDDGGGGGNDGGDGVSVAEPADGSPSSSSSLEATVLFSEWLRQHPDALSLNSLFLDDLTCGGEGDGSSGGQTTAGPACSASKLGSAEGTVKAVGSHKRLREAEMVEGTAQGCYSSSRRSGSGASFVASEAQSTATATVYKNYELVGVVRGSVLFNSKPARVFHSRR